MTTEHKIFDQNQLNVTILKAQLPAFTQEQDNVDLLEALTFSIFFSYIMYILYLASHVDHVFKSLVEVVADLKNRKQNHDS